jgi:hypothetical protein
VAGEADEVGAQRGDVHEPVRDRLGGVHQYQGPDRVCARRQVGDRVDGAEHVRLVRDRHDLGPLVDQLVSLVKVEPPVRRHAEPAQLRAGPLAEHLPRHDVGVVFHLGDDDLIALPDPQRSAGGVAERVGDQVDALGDVLGEHDL